MSLKRWFAPTKRGITGTAVHADKKPKVSAKDKKGGIIGYLEISGNLKSAHRSTGTLQRVKRKRLRQNPHLSRNKAYA